VLTETHRIHVKAFDSAGNEAESEPVQILVMHKPKEKKTSALFGASASTPVALAPERWRWQPEG